MKKFILTTMIAALLVLPLEGVALAQSPEIPLSDAPVMEEMDFTHGAVPAQTNALDSMTPAIHGVILAMLHQEQTQFQPSDPLTGWEALYNMLSLYGQMDDRADWAEEEMILPPETVMDYSAALVPNPEDLGELPEDLSDRIVYDGEADGFRLTCGSDSLAQVELASAQATDHGLELSGSLVYLVDGTDLAHFQAVLQPADNLFGYTILSLELL